MNDREKTRFVIVGTYRSGSSAVTEAMNSHPRIMCGYEWTLPIPFWKKIRVAKSALGGVFAIAPAPSRRGSVGISPATSVIGFNASSGYLISG